jgi:predicted nucleic acid-binding protein
VILLDANVLMYAVRTEHPNKRPSAALLERVGAEDVEATVDAERLQELLHRYRSLDRRALASEVYELTRRLFPMVLPITAEIVDAAHRLMNLHPRLMCRDAVHAAVVQVGGFAAICSYDRDFDVVEGLRRVEPDAVA